MAAADINGESCCSNLSSPKALCRCRGRRDQQDAGGHHHPDSGWCGVHQVLHGTEDEHGKVLTPLSAGKQLIKGYCLVLVSLLLLKSPDLKNKSSLESQNH